MLKIIDITLHFGGIKALNGVTFDITKGGVVGLIGPNGAGKTSLLNIISGIYKPTRGKATYNDVEINNLPFYKVNQLGIARTFQNLMTFPRLTALQNVLIGRQSRTKSGVFANILRTRSAISERRAAQRLALELLEYVGLGDKGSVQAGTLAYGQQRQLDIARALATEPDMLLLDEPAAGLNSHERTRLHTLIEKLKTQGYTVLVIEHDMDFIMSLCSQVAVLKFGELIAYDTPSEIQKDKAVIQAYLGEPGNV